MSGSPADFSFPALGGQQQTTVGFGAAVQPQQYPQPQYAQPQQQYPQPQYQQQQPQPQQQPLMLDPVKPASLRPLTAQSTVVHATCTAAAGAGRQQQQQQQQQQPVPLQVAAEGRRNKVPLEKGFSQVSWLKVSKSGADLTGGAGRRRDITLEEVRQHKSADDAWIVLQGKVYNITPYLRYHPGGADILVKAAGRDATKLFNKYHPWVNAHMILDKCLLGQLAKPEQEQEAEAAAAAAAGSGGGAAAAIKSRLAQVFRP